MGGYGRKLFKRPELKSEPKTKQKQDEKPPNLAPAGIPLDELVFGKPKAKGKQK